jgi:hypothetical protein
MPLYRIPHNIGKVRVVVAHGGTFAAWNGKHGKHEFRVLTRTKKLAEEVATIINTRAHHGQIDVLDHRVVIPPPEQRK